MDQCDQQAFDLVINATASGISREVPALPAGVVNAQTRCYDAVLSAGASPFLAWAQKRGQREYADGLGMLVGPGGMPFLLWHGVIPEIEPVLPAAQRTGSINPPVLFIRERGLSDVFRQVFIFPAYIVVRRIKQPFNSAAVNGRIWRAGLPI